MATTDEEVPEDVRVITWKGRTFWVLEPDEGQILAVTRMANLQPSKDMTLERMLGWLNRAPRLVISLCARASDEDWFEDAFVDRTVKVEELPDFMAEVVKAWWLPEAEDNRTAKRAPAKKAAKKAGARRVA